jgi:hypothetical protein
MTQRVMQGIICKLSNKLSNRQRFRTWSPPKARFAQGMGRTGESTPHFGARAGNRTLNLGIKRRLTFLAWTCQEMPGRVWRT